MSRGKPPSLGSRHEEATTPLRRGDASPRPAPLGALVRVVGSNATPSTFRLRVGTCTVGSCSTADLVVDEPTVSRAHVELGLLPEGVSVRDLGSRNGTYFQGQRVEKMILGFGGQLKLGGATVSIEVDSEGLATMPAFEGTSYRGIVGASHVMRRVFAILKRLEGSLATVLVEGESGVGKELVARALHEGSSVSGGPFVAINCGAIPKDLVASELFGHRRGAFSGAQEARRGAFESANGGTLFLDELGELPIDVQPVLLRALELGEIRAVGDDHPRKVKVRVVAATNRNLEGEVQTGRFRQDLFYRLAVVRLAVPALRERPDDIELLARSFAERAGLGELPPELLAELRSRPWPGNVRELQNAVQSYAALGMLPGGAANVSGLDQALALFADPAAPYGPQKDALIDRFTRAYLLALMGRTGGNQSAAARIAGLNRSYLGRLLVKHSIPRVGAGEAWDTNDEPGP